MQNILLDSDSYKHSHARQYPPRTQHVYSYFECRPGGKFQSSVFFGLQYILQEYLTGKVVTIERIKEAQELCAAHFGDPLLFNSHGWMHIHRKHDGRLPLRIMAVQEGTEVNTGNVLFTVENTDPEVPWLTNFVETALMRLWYPLTVATQSNEFKKIWLQYLNRTGSPDQVDFKLHDFGCRGVSSHETAGIGGLAHLLSFRGTDTLPALCFARKHYGCQVAGFSIPASEHSTITSWGKEGEADAYENMLKQYPTGTFACVSDSYDIYNAITKIWGGVLKDAVLTRDGVLVVRPDSGHPPTVVLDCLKRMGAAFGYETNSKGYKVLDPHVRLIQGDGIDLDMCETILHHMEQWGWSADNIAMGSGGALLQKVNRDTLKCAIKASSVTVDGVSRDVSKSPVTDAGKKSKAGKLKLCKKGDFYYTARQEDPGNDHLVEVFKNGEITKSYTLDQCRKTLQDSMMFEYPDHLRIEQW